MTMYGMHYDWVLQEITGVELDGKTYTEEQLAEVIKAYEKARETEDELDRARRELSALEAAYSSVLRDAAYELVACKNEGYETGFDAGYSEGREDARRFP
jgi:flagellar biosynthesis/type III secretory pathway protein FliH